MWRSTRKRERRQKVPKVTVGIYNSPLIKKHERQRTKKGTPITDDRNGFAGDPRRAYVRHTVMWSEPLINAARNPAERFFHLMLHSTSTLITTSISSHRLKYLTTNTHTWRQIQNLNWSRCSEYGVRNWRHTRICGGCQIPISAGTAFVQKRLWSTSLGLNCFRASVAGAMFNFLSSLIRCV